VRVLQLASALHHFLLKFDACVALFGKMPLA
jgi:hypothetical protein